MLEAIINPKSGEKSPWKMFFVGLVYASLSLLLVHFLFPADPLANGMTVVAFCIMFSLPFMYHVIKIETKQDEQSEGLLHVWKVHNDAIFAFMFLFLGFVVAFSFWNVVLHDANLLNFQVETYCRINSPGDVEGCINIVTGGATDLTGGATRTMRFFSILENNIFVMIFTLIFSLLFGAGAIFILIWNASVIAAAVGIFSNNTLAAIPMGLFRYMIHGFPEIAAYFITALAGGIFSVGLMRHGIKDKKFIHIIENTAILLFVAVVVLLIAALMEVYLTPIIFG
jgi:uncharacterized membrane protein SpoIIM required for sporulation